MKNIMEYKGYHGSVEYSDQDEVFYGQVLFINDVITFEGTDVKSLKEGFHLMVDDYLEMCQRLNKQPDKPFSGSFNIRTGSELHKKIAIFAEKQGKSLNKVVVEALEKYIA